MKQTIQSIKDNLDDHLAKIVLHSGTVLLAYAISFMIIEPVQTQIFPDMFSLVALFYLPFGIKIISAFFEGYRSMIYLAPGYILAYMLFLNISFTSPMAYFTILISYGTAPSVFKILDWSKADGGRTLSASQAWRTLVLGGVITSLIISMSIHALWQQTIEPTVLLTSMMRLIIGDLLGLAVVLSVLIAIFRIMRRASTLRRIEKA